MNESEKIKRIYEIEKELARKLRNSDRIKRKSLYTEVYNEYFNALRDEDLHVKITGENRTGTTFNKDVYLKMILEKSNRILEIGCGSGETLRYLWDGSKQLTGLDVNESVIKNSGKGIKFVQGSALDIKLEPDSFDAAFSVDCVEHLHFDDMQAHLASVQKVLCRKGMYLVITPNRFTGPHDISMYFDTTPQGFHLKEYTHKDLAGLFRSAGFTDIRTSLFPYVLYRKFRFLRFLASVPYYYKVLLENILGNVTTRKFRKHIFKCTGIYAVCISGKK